MKTMIWKELRENARWGALAFLCMLLAQIYALTSQRESFDSGITLCNTTFLLVSAFGCSLIGAALGAVQILPELRRDQWASLLHRPVSRGVIFLGKAAAGLALYALATGLPLLVSIAYAAWPGQFAAPFVPALALPATSDLLLGVVFYFTALLLGLQPGRWFGARGAIALGSVGVLMLHLSRGWTFSLPVLAAAILFAAAWGAMQGVIGARPWLARLALGLVMLVGVETALLLSGTALQWTPLGPKMFSGYTSFCITRDGQVLRMSVEGGGLVTLTDLEGKPITDPRYLSNDDRQHFLQNIPLSYSRQDPAVAFRGLSARIPRNSHVYVQPVTRDYGNPENWYQIVGPKNHFVGYDKLSGRCIAICDSDGFKDATATIRPFATDPHNGSFNQSLPYLYSVGPQLFAIDFSERKMTPLFHAGSETIYGAVKFPYGREGGKYLAVALDSEIRIFDPEGILLHSLPYGHDPARWSFISIGATSDLSRIFLEYRPDFYAVNAIDLPLYLDEIDAAGRLTRTYESPQNSIRTLPTTWITRLVRLITPPIPSLAATLWKRSHPSDPAEISPTVPGTIEGLTNRELTVLAIFAAALGSIAFLWARRIGLSPAQTAIWVILSLTFGIAGLLAFRLATDWPIRIPCPQCARRRPVRTSACPHCHETWAPPTASGTEIIEPASAA